MQEEVMVGWAVKQLAIVLTSVALLDMRVLGTLHQKSSAVHWNSISYSLSSVLFLSPRSFECQDRLCVDISNGEPFAPCRTNEDCFREGDVCAPDGKCVASAAEEQTFPPDISDGTTPCTEEQSCPQHTCLQGTYCPIYVCDGGVCVTEDDGGDDCEMDEDCLQPICPPEQDFCPRLICMDGICVTDDQPRPDDCQVNDDCPQPGCPPEMEVCPMFLCIDGRCVVEDPPVGDECEDISECNPPCPPEEACPITVSCENGLCIVHEQAPPECENDWQCPQPDCLPDSDYCPFFICVDGNCVEGGDPVFCTQDVQECPDGSFVGRVGPQCEFAPCPVYLKCNTNDDCDIPEHVCDPEQGICVDMNHGCPEDVRICFDGTTVQRVPPSCDFPECPASDGRCLSDADCDFPNEECNLEQGFCVDGFGHIKCGSTSWCEPEQVCCNPSCGICTDPDGVCTQQICPPPVPCGENVCTNGQVCCNASCGICTEPGMACTQQACLGPPTVVECCDTPKPSDVECGRSGCHCCGNGEWVTGNSGPSLLPEEVCGDLGVSMPCDEEESLDKRPCETIADCPAIACLVAPCPEIVCQDGFCIMLDD